MQTLQIPNPLKDLSPVNYDLKKIAEAESRVHEISFMSPTKAAELISVFAVACFDLAEVFSDLYLRHRYAKKRVSDRKAVVVLDIMPQRLSDKKAANNAETRQAVIDLDEEYSKAIYVEIEIEAALKLIQGKLFAMEGALSAVKQVSYEVRNTYNRQNPNLMVPEYSMSSEVKEESPAPQDNTQTSPTGVKYGKPRYR
jgi:hypothetical protein